MCTSDDKHGTIGHPKLSRKPSHSTEMDSFVYSTVETDGSSKSREFGFGLAGSGQFGPVAATVSASLDVTGSSSRSSTKSGKVAGTKLTVKTFSSQVAT